MLDQKVTERRKPGDDAYATPAAPTTPTAPRAAQRRNVVGRNMRDKVAAARLC